jgi:hypothetical protein
MRAIFRLVALLWLGAGPAIAVERGLPALAPTPIDCLETTGTEPLTVLQARWLGLAANRDQAFAKASDTDRTAALMLLERHLRERPY